ncbi:MAG: TatD family hydrolase [Kineosporiaceae bacterium]|jgi:TatD DNase family protein|nr:TatD family hydrolase [Kineosporiaceae bacterium]MBK7622880.1 TatD family hydrolase [Kineosporiaceae bacterium]
MPDSLEPAVPQPLPVAVVDNHTHLDHVRRGDVPLTLDQAIAAAEAVNVTRLVQIGCDLDSARWSVDVAARRPQVVAGVSLHPTQASKIVAEQGGSALREAFADIEALATHPRVRVIGETGLDHYWVPADDTEGRAAQEESFRFHIDLAKRTGKVLQIHDRDAHDDVLRVLAEEGAPERTVFHCFSGSEQMARVCAEAGWYLSFAGPLTFANADPLRAALRAVSPEQVLVETDAPYLTPHPHRGKRNASYLMPLTVRRMAAEWQLDDAALCARLNATSEALYGPW